MNSCCSTPTPKEKKFGVKVCRERKCSDLQRDPKYPDSPEFCQVTHGMPGAMPCCVKEMDAERFIMCISGQLNSSPYTAPHPGVRNCPKECPYRIEKEMICGFTGKPLKAWGVCPCNVLGNPLQDEQIKRLQIITHARLKNTDPTVGLCQMGICPDGKDRGGPCTEDDRCPIIKLPYGDFGIGMGCPLWRIPAKLLPVPDPEVEKEPADPVGKVTQKEKNSPRGSSPKEKKKEKARTIEDRIDSLEQDLEIYLWADITQCCVLIQEIKCLLRSIKKKEKPPAKIHKAAPRIEPNQSDLFSFDVQPEETADAKIPHIGWCSQRACPELDWEGGICITTGKKIKEQTYCPTQHLADKQMLKVRKCCPTCKHHKAKKTFEKTCPRLPDLMFEGGHMSAMALMLETSLKDCQHWIQKPEKPAPEQQKPNCGGKRPAINRCPDNCPDRSIEKEGGYPQGRYKVTKEKLREMKTCPNDPPKVEKKPGKKPKPYTIYIKKSDGKHPLIVSCDSQGHGGTSNPCDTQEEVIKRALATLDGFVHDIKKSTLSKKPLQVTIETTLFIDKTGMFKITDFFDEKGEPKKPEPVKKTKNKKEQ